MQSQVLNGWRAWDEVHAQLGAKWMTCLLSNGQMCLIDGVNRQCRYEQTQWWRVERKDQDYDVFGSICEDRLRGFAN